MNIGVDAGCLSVKDERLKLGVYQMTFNLLCELGKIDQKNEYWLYSFAPIEAKVLSHFGPRMRNVVARPFLGWQHFGLPLHLFLKKPDIFLGLSHALPLFTFSSSIVVVYDLAFVHFPESYPGFGKRLRKITQSAITKAKKIIAVSKATKQDLINIYQLPPEKIKVIYGGYNPFFKVQNQKAVGKIKKKYHLEKDYFLFVGALKKTKNVPKIVSAFAEFLKKSKKDFFLVLAGSDFWLDDEIEETIRYYSLNNRVVFLGYLPFDDLPGLYAGAQALVSPSLYEGFGMTFLEAMVCGCPVIGGDNSAVREVVGKAGVLVNPRHKEAITEAMIELVKSKKVRTNLIKKGFKRIKKFSWRKTAQEFLKVIEKIDEN